MKFLMLPQRTWHWVLLVMVLTVTIATLFWLVLPSAWQVNESSDYLTFYAPVARNLLDGRWMKQLDGTPATKYPPGFPIVLAIISAVSDSIPLAGLNWLTLFILFSMICSALLLFSIGQTLYPPPVALLAVLLWLTYPIALWTTKQPNSEIAFLPFFLGAVALFWYGVQHGRDSNGLFFTVGVLVGLAMLIRPVALGLGLLLCILLVIWRRRDGVREWLIPGGLIISGNFVVILPWLFWLSQQTGQITLLSTNGPSSIRDGLTFAVNSRGYRDPMAVQPDIARVMRTFFQQAPIVDSLGTIARSFCSAFMAAPLAVVKLILWKAARSLYGTDSHRLERPILLIQLVYLLLISAGAGIAWNRKGISRQAGQMILLMMFYFWGMTILVLSIVRYMLPAMALLMLFIPFLLVKTPLNKMFQTT